jgi:hypothetical protein
MPMTPELVIAMLGCARIGAVHSVIFGGFSSEAIADRDHFDILEEMDTPGGALVAPLLRLLGLPVRG